VVLRLPAVQSSARAAFFCVNLLTVAGKWDLFHADYMYVAPKFATKTFYTRTSHSWEMIQHVYSHYTHVMHIIRERTDKWKYYYR
jgi:hypothetical protein